MSYAKNIAQCRARFQFISNILVSSVVLPYIFCSLSQELKPAAVNVNLVLAITVYISQPQITRILHIIILIFLNYEHYNTALGLSL